ncbi:MULTISPECIES: Abi family protein [unclassified Staphylococcus]|uniref:Abi family protein n=1 Tax=unclassified Staphylococcus TaxID=91994 RepID=UPI0021D38537|nr:MULTISPECIES: Abi family protein [unclassified Staphylococcus]UXR78280.1 Abi family protein [Staphylococcus sp. IVB6227]UXR82444.1 Abi family protein [Staphylococcus sp. IVB6214]
MSEKIYKTDEERIEILKERNMTINKESSIHREVISNYNYYNVVNAYKDLFLEKGTQSERYISGTTPDQLLAIYKFDEALRITLLRYLLKIEEKVKHCITQSFFSHFLNDENLAQSEKDTLHKDSSYINKKYYDTSNSKKEDTFSRFQEIAYNQINSQYKKDNSSIKKYKDEHGYIPMWVLFNILMFGNISKFFTILNKDIKVKVMKLMGIKWGFQVEQETIEQFESTLEILTLARNVCAHNERLYCFKHNIPLKDRYLSFKKALPSPEESDFNAKANMKFSIYSVIFLISKFIEKTENQAMLDEINREVEKLEESLSAIDIYEVLGYMKMPNNWEKKLS